MIEHDEIDCFRVELDPHKDGNLRLTLKRKNIKDMSPVYVWDYNSEEKALGINDIIELVDFFGKTECSKFNIYFEQSSITNIKNHVMTMEKEISKYKEFMGRIVFPEVSALKTRKKGKSK